MKDFRFYVHTPGVVPLAGFNELHRAAQYIEFVRANGYNMELEIVDQAEAMQREQARRKRVERILEAVRVLKGAA